MSFIQHYRLSRITTYDHSIHKKLCFKMGSLSKMRARGRYSIYMWEPTSSGWTLHECKHVKVLVLWSSIQAFLRGDPCMEVSYNEAYSQIIQNNTILVVKLKPMVLGIPHFKKPPPHRPKSQNVSRLAVIWSRRAKCPRVFCAFCYAKSW